MNNKSLVYRDKNTKNIPSLLGLVDGSVSEFLNILLMVSSLTSESVKE